LAKGSRKIERHSISFPCLSDRDHLNRSLSITALIFVLWVVMRHPTSLENIRQVMQAFGSRIKQPLKIYFTGGTTCVLKGWRDSTVDIDLKSVPDLGKVYDVIAKLKEELHLNIETASPDHFMPALPGWEERSEWIDTVGEVKFYNYDIYAQILSKIARGFDQDLSDARKMMVSKNPDILLELYSAIQPEMVRYPAIDDKELLKKVTLFLDELSPSA
jgi:hypothetical protein